MVVTFFIMGVAGAILLYDSDHSSALPLYAGHSGASAIQVVSKQEAQREDNLRKTATVRKDSGISGKVVVIDAGHGGFDCGAIGASGSHEDDLNLAVAQCLQNELVQGGAQVILTRKDENATAPTKDEDMEKRRQVIVGSHSDIVVSIHMNTYEDPDIAGHIVYYMQNSLQGEALAQAIGNRMDRSLDNKRKNSVQPNDYFILKSGAQPCVLIECGFISNPEEEANLQDPDYQKRLGKAIFDGIVAYFESDV